MHELDTDVERIRLSKGGRMSAHMIDIYSIFLRRAGPLEARNRTYHTHARGTYEMYVESLRVHIRMYIVHLIRE